MTKLLGNALKPIPVDESLLQYLQPKQRLEFIKQMACRRCEIKLWHVKNSPECSRGMTLSVFSK